jgi:hypothetical protein
VILQLPTPPFQTRKWLYRALVFSLCQLFIFYSFEQKEQAGIFVVLNERLHEKNSFLLPTVYSL